MALVSVCFDPDVPTNQAGFSASIHGMPDDEFRRWGFVWRHRDRLTEIVQEVAEKHPLDKQGTLRAPGLHVCIRVDPPAEPGSAPATPRIDATRFPRLLLTVPLEPHEQSCEGLRPVVYHEFTHVIDRQDPSFGITEELQERASNSAHPCPGIGIWPSTFGT